MTDRNDIHYELRSKLNSGNGCFLLVHNVTSFRVVDTKLYIYFYNINSEEMSSNIYFRHFISLGWHFATGRTWRSHHCPWMLTKAENIADVGLFLRYTLHSEASLIRRPIVRLPY
jgi:hypothetical protein